MTSQCPGVKSNQQLKFVFEQCTMMFYDWRMVLDKSDPLSSKEPSVERLMASFFVRPFTCLLAQVTQRFLVLQMCCSSPNVVGERQPRHTAEKLERCTHNTFECTGWRHCCWDCWIRLAWVPNRTVLIGQFISWFLWPPTLPGLNVLNCTLLEDLRTVFNGADVSQY